MRNLRTRNEITENGRTRNGRNGKRERTTKIVLTALFAALIAIGAFLKIPVPAVPFTLQFFFANMTVLFLGKKWGTLAVGIYLTLGLIGVPIFTGGGGIFYVLHPTFGYLIGFLAGNFIAGSFLERVNRAKYGNLVVAGFLNAAAVYFFGLVYFYLISTLYLNNTVTIKTLLVTCFLMTFWSDTIFIFFTAFVAKKINRQLHIDYAGNPSADVSRLKRKILKGYRITKNDVELLMNAPLPAIWRTANAIKKRIYGNKQINREVAEAVYDADGTRKEQIETFVKLENENAAAIRLRFGSDFKSDPNRNNPPEIHESNADSVRIPFREIARTVAVCRIVLPSAKISVEGETSEEEARKLLSCGANVVENCRKNVSVDTK